MNKIFFIFLQYSVNFRIDAEKYFSYNAVVKRFQFPYIIYLFTLPPDRGSGDFFCPFLMQNDEKFNKSNFLFIFTCIYTQLRYNVLSLIKNTRKFTDTKSREMADMEIGRKIKRLRIQKGLTLEELASRSELTKGFLSQLERDLTSPSIATLNDIVEALGSSLAEFFKEEEKEQLVFRKKDFFVDEKDNYTIHWIVPNTQKNEMEPILLELPQGNESFGMDPHSGEEFGYVLEGTVVLINGEEKFTVHKGETFYLSGKRRHYLKNEKKTTAKVLWISTPPLF